jgi:Tfp pilus assembly protein PilF
MSPNVEKGHYYLAEAYRASGDKAKACEHYRQAAERNDISQDDLTKRCP